MARYISASRWALAVPVGVVAWFIAGFVVNEIVGTAQPTSEWQTNVIRAVILLVGSLATGAVAGARTPREGFQAALLTLAGLLAVVVVVFVYVVGTEPPP
jgi:peptidoglycan/LPS O-acetylase OafA/YrhL